MLPIFWNQDFGTVKALQSRYNQALFGMGRHHHLSVELAAIGLRFVYGDDVTVVEHGHHRATLYS